jgi:acetolactate synthase-1/2/3 large subunit
MQFHAPISMPRPAPARSEIEQVGVMLQNARKPVVIAGGGIKAAGAEDVLQQFSEKYALPVAIAFRRHDVFPNDHPNYIGHLGLGAPEELRDTVAVADVVLVLGSRLSEVTTQDYSLLQPNQKLIHVDIHEESLGKVYPPTVGIVADCKEAITALLDLPVEVCFQEWTKKAHAQYVAATNVDAKVINHHIIHCMQEMLPHDAVITNDAGNFASWLHRYYPFTQKDTYIGPTSGAMGYGLPAAIGAKLADPDRVVVSLSGDGGLMMTVQELETAVRHQVATIHIVFNNDMYGTIRMHQEMHYPGRVVGTDLGAVSFTKLAESLGANGIKVETADEFKHALGVALQNTTATLIEVITDQEQISAGKTITALRKKI